MLLNILIPVLLQVENFTDGITNTLFDKLGEWSTVIVIIAYLIYQLIRDNQRNKQESLKSSASLKFQNTIYQQLEINDNTNKKLLNYLKIATNKYSNEVTEAQMRILVDKVLEASKYAINSYISKIMKENHVEGNEEETNLKIKQYISNRHETDCLVFSEYNFKSLPIDTVMQDEWTKELFEITSNVVINTKSYKVLNSSLNNKFDEYKNKMLILLLARKSSE